MEVVWSEFHSFENRTQFMKEISMELNCVFSKFYSFGFLKFTLKTSHNRELGSSFLNNLPILRIL